MNAPAGKQTLSRWITFRQSGRGYAVPAARVLAIVQDSPITSVPGTPEALAGLMSLKGELIPVLEGSAMLAVAGERPGRRTLVLECHGRAVGLRVEDIQDAMDLPEPVTPAAWLAGEDLPEVIGQRFHQCGDTRLQLIDPERLIGEDGTLHPLLP